MSTTTDEMAPPPAPLGLDDAEAAARLRALGPEQLPSSRSTASIVAGNVFTLFNAIIGVFFILILSLGLWADAIFGLIAILNTWIGIRQELKAKEVLDRLALLVAPRARTIRAGREVELLAGEVVPGDLVRLGPGDQLVADGVTLEARGLTLDESLLTGESEGVSKAGGDQLLSGAFVTSGSGLCEVTAVRDESYAGRLVGEARAFRHPPAPLQKEVNRVIVACTWALIPLAILLIGSLALRNTPIVEAAQTATAGLITLIPEGLVLLMSVTFAVAAVRLARRSLLVQQMSATESLSSVDTICVDKTGTLTDGHLELTEVVPASEVEVESARQLLAIFAASIDARNSTLEAIAAALPGEPAEVLAEVPFSSEWKWSALALRLPDGVETLVLGAPDVLAEAGSLNLEGSLSAVLDRESSAGRRVVAFGRTDHDLPGDPEHGPPATIEPLALVVFDEKLREGVVETLDLMRREDVALKVISGDGEKTVEAVAKRVGIPVGAGIVNGSDLPEDPEELIGIARDNSVFCRIRPEQKKALVAALGDAGCYTAMIGDGVNDVPALKKARMAVGMGSGSQITRSVADVVLMKDEFERLPEAIAEGRRIARNIHRLGRLYLTKSVYAAALILLVAVPGFDFPFLPRQVTLAALITIGIPSFVLALAPSDGPLYRGHLLRALGAFAVPAGLATALATIFSFLIVGSSGTLDEGRTAATTTLVVLGLSFILLLERGPGREHISIQGYMLAMIAGLGALFAGILAIDPLRQVFEMTFLTAAQWFFALLSAALGLTIASLMWRIPLFQEWESPAEDRTPPLER